MRCSFYFSKYGPVSSILQSNSVLLLNLKSLGAQKAKRSTQRIELSLKGSLATIYYHLKMDLNFLILPYFHFVLTMELIKLHFQKYVEQAPLEEC
jgi:hypothetical protein